MPWLAKCCSSFILLMVIVVRSKSSEENDGASYVTKTEDVSFEQMKPFDTPPIVEKAVWFIEHDLNRERTFIVADGSALKTFNHDFEPLNQRTIVGNSLIESYREGRDTEARFNMISGFAQINETHILVVDSNNHCIRYVDRREQSTSRYAGQCETSGMINGTRLNAAFNQPKQIIVIDRQRTALVTDYGNRKIRSLKLRRDTVETFKTIPQPLTAIAKDNREEWVYITTISQVWRVNLDTRRLLPITRSLIPGFRDGDFEWARFDQPTSIVNLGKDTLLIAEPKHNRLRVLDRKKERVSSICNGDDDFIDSRADIYSCQIDQPYSLIATRNIIIIGTNSSTMRVLQYRRENRRRPNNGRQPSRPDPKENTSTTESTGKDKSKGKQTNDSLVTIVTIVTVGVIVTAVVIAVSIVVYKRCSTKTQKKTAGPTEHLDMAVRNTAAQQQTKHRTGIKSGIYHTVSNPYSTYEDVEDPYQTLENKDDQYYSQLDVEDGVDRATPSPRSLRYGPLPCRPTSDGVQQQPPSDDYYCSAEHITAVDSEDEKPVESSNSTEKKEDYGYVDFDQDTCSHEKVDIDTKEDE